MGKRIRTLEDIVRWRLCVGCGACAYLGKPGNIRLEHVPESGVRPRIEDPSLCGEDSDCLRGCPAWRADFAVPSYPDQAPPAVTRHFGSVLGIWEGHATDEEIRYKGSSGGLLTALSLYGLERRGMHGVLHIGQDPDLPSRNRTFMSRSREDLLRRTGSCYAAASACDGLGRIEAAPAPCVFIGQPSEVTALRKAQRLRPALDRRVGLALSFFCAGSPAAAGTVELLRREGVDPARIDELRYRGNGWPGHFTARAAGERDPLCTLSYAESWAFLQKFRPIATHLWPDGTGEHADIACGDPWYRDIEPDEPGSSLVLARTPLGREFLLAAIADGYVALTPAEPWKLARSQQNLVDKRRLIWGRRLAFRLMGLPLTQFAGLDLFRLWRELPLSRQFRSTAGTARRILRRKYYRPLPRADHASKPAA